VRAGNCLIEGNALKRQEVTYDEVGTLRTFDRIRAIFTPQFIQSKQGFGNRSPEPIFILGMPRSGSTLIEQIIASHPRVYGAGGTFSSRSAQKSTVNPRKTIGPRWCASSATMIPIPFRKRIRIVFSKRKS
jgi:hypothetical protein